MELKKKIEIGLWIVSYGLSMLLFCWTLILNVVHGEIMLYVVCAVAFMAFAISSFKLIELSGENHRARGIENE